MTTYNWGPIRDKFGSAVGSDPGAQLEEEFIRHFKENPRRVVHTLNKVAADYKAGGIISPWPLALARLNRTAVTDTVTADDGKTNAKAIARAETWIQRTGIHFDRESEVEDELFGDRGILKPFKDDDQLRARMIDLWHQQRHIGVRLEREMIVRLGQRRIVAARAARIAKRQPQETDDFLAGLTSEGGRE